MAIESCLSNGSGPGEKPDTPGAPAVLACAATGVVTFIERLGGDVDSIFGNAGIAPEMAGSPTLKLGLDAYCTLFEEASRRTRHDNFGLWFGHQFQPRDLGLWGYAVVSAPTLGAAIEELVGLFPYHQEQSSMCLVEARSGLLSLEYKIDAPQIIDRRQDAELSLGMFQNVFREALGRQWAAEEVYFEHPRPSDWREHERAFGAPVYFAQPTNALVFRKDVLAHRMPAADLRLMDMMRMCLAKLARRTDMRESMADRVRNAVRARLPEGYPPLEAISEALRLTPGTIQRALAREGSSYAGLVETTRRDLALAYIRQAQLSFSEIALLLGYSELSAFSRAVRRWTGLSPRALRLRPVSHS